jgi:CRISPR/Cas system-associated exonuclease Cas4 (RecB family)
MSPFLKLVANDLTARFGIDLSGVTLVFPNRRAQLFFNQYLANIIEKPVWAPQVTTIPEIMHKISGFQNDDPISLVTKLFLIYRKIKGNDEPFENFYFWGEVMLADFDQIDKYMVNAQQLFSNIKDIKDIEERFGGLTPEQTEALRDYIGVMSNDTQPSELKSNYLSIWNILGEIYKEFKENLENEGLSYEGMAYRRAAEILTKGESSFGMSFNIAFVGFNALNECEKILFKYFKKECKALFYWDYDPEFLDNPNHEAGYFIRDNIAVFGNALPREIFENKFSSTKEVQLVSAPSTVAQCKLVPRILDEMKGNGALLNQSTAIVLPSESILIPTLQAIPSEVGDLNITMGYPLKETPAFSLAEFLIKLQMNLRMGKENDIRFYHRDVFSVLNHPYIRVCEPEKASHLVSELKRLNRIYPKSKTLSVSPLLSTIFEKSNSEEPLSTYLIAICNEVAKTISHKLELDKNQQHRIDLEFLYALFKSLNRLHGVISSLGFDVSNKVFLQLLRKVFSQERVSFSGEPLAGLQLMGFLETRTLDFENIIILSFNDDILPGRNHPVSFVTPSLRVAFGLPNHKHNDALYAYYFYRLLHRAKRIYLVYSNRTEGLSSGEVSRFGLQLEMEQMVGRVKKISVGYDLNITPPIPIIIDKKKDVLERLIQNLTREGKGITLSPSGLTSYIACPLRFYFRYCAGIHEEDEIADEIGALEFGKIIHKTMEGLYSEFTGKIVSTIMVENIQKNKQKIEEVLNKAFQTIYLKQDKSDDLETLSGRNIIARNAMLYTINKMLLIDKNRTPFHLISHEAEVYLPVVINNSSLINNIMLGGIIDRLEKKDDTIWVIDYKTGRYDKGKGRFDSVEELFDTNMIDTKKEVFQILCYCLAIMNNYSEVKIKPAVWFVKNIKTSKDLQIEYKQDKIFIPVDDFTPFSVDFQKNIEYLISEIFNPSVPFTQTTKTERCQTCPFISICGRE